VPSLRQWAFVVRGKPLAFTADGHWQANDTNVMAGMVLQGLGIGRMATLAGEPLVHEGRLLRVMEEFVDPQAVPVYAVTLANRHRLPKIGACLDWWTEWFGRSDPGGAPAPAQ
jgi:DNA-binding transcriptional LysR family regulator